MKSVRKRTVIVQFRTQLKEKMFGKEAVGLIGRRKLNIVPVKNWF